MQNRQRLDLALDRINRSLDEKKGGGGGDGGAGLESVRQNFADTALWWPILSREKGLGKVEAALPDTLTTGCSLAKGVTGRRTRWWERTGSRLSAVKALLVRR